jgi:hypothetical protein
LKNKTWKERIESARDGGFEIEDKIEASSWFTCAVGERIGSHTAPQDLPPELRKLGHMFENAVWSGNIDLAKKINEQILTFRLEPGTKEKQ